MRIWAPTTPLGFHYTTEVNQSRLQLWQNQNIPGSLYLVVKSLASLAFPVPPRVKISVSLDHPSPFQVPLHLDGANSGGTCMNARQGPQGVRRLRDIKKKEKRDEQHHDTIPTRLVLNSGWLHWSVCCLELHLQHDSRLREWRKRKSQKNPVYPCSRPFRYCTLRRSD